MNIDIEANGEQHVSGCCALIVWPPLWLQLETHLPLKATSKESVSVAFKSSTANPAATGKPTKTGELCRICKSARFRDVPIHGGQSIRRDCALCGKFHGFPVWYGENRDGIRE